MEDEKRSKIKWVNKTGKVSLDNGKTYKRGEPFLAHEEEIPKGARDVIKPLDAIPAPAPLVPVIGFEIVPSKDKPDGWFNVINVMSKKPINNKGLRQEEAELMLSNLLEG